MENWKQTPRGVGYKTSGQSFSVAAEILWAVFSLS